MVEGFRGRGPVVEGGGVTRGGWAESDHDA